MGSGPLFWSGRRVLVTGHTGFKGTWLCQWLSELGARVTGVGLEPATEPSLFYASGLARQIDSRILDVRARDQLAAVLRGAAPEIVFHLAAQPLVAASLTDPLGTFQTNVQGVVNLLESARHLEDLRAIVVVTSDKCYLEPDRRCREDDRLGGHDPYSASKACAEMVVEAYRSCFFPPESGRGLATARAGNVIGGGDFAPARLLPDLMRAFAEGRPALLRQPGSVRPWQHVLDALAGYLELAERLYHEPAACSTAWNFGPDAYAIWTAARVADAAVKRFGTGSWQAAGTGIPIEVPTLMLSSERAQRRLGWRPRLGTAEAVAWAVDGYRELLREASCAWLVRQIHAFEELAAPPLLAPVPTARHGEPTHAVA
ncbi:MAG: CDP-glucose 4,6-dehydratase [Geminicoccaceae bacterium]